MKLIKKSMIAIGLVGVAFSLFSYLYFERIQQPFLSFLPIGFSFLCVSLIIVLILYSRLLKNIFQLKNEIKDILEKKSLESRIKIKKDSDFDEIASQFNNLLDQFRSETADLKTRLKNQVQKLHEENIALKKGLSEKKLIAEGTEPINNGRQCLTRIARYDGLTSLPNRVFFNEILNKAMNHANRHQKILSVLFIDIDSFHSIIEKVGKEKSDILLKEISHRFIKCLRSEDVIAKLDGDEFIVLLNDIGKPKFASTVAEKLLAACIQPIQIDATPLILTASIGISIYPHDGETLEDILKNANNALFKAKRMGKGFYQFYTHEMSLEAREYIQLESALRNATRNNELVLYYQPKFRIKTGTVTGVEALMRWEHPVLGIVSPSTFIPHAEETGFIIQIGEWALKTVCEKTKYWQDEGYAHLTVAIKLSNKQFHHPSLSTIITNTIKESQLNAKYLELEIDEKTLMTDIEESKTILDKLKETGVQIAIDHFGIGYTSISHLKKFPISTVKIDQSYIKGIPHHQDDIAIVSALIALAHNLGLEVVAEGVETAEQVEFLTSQQCDILQGYFLGNPSPPEKVMLQFSKLRDEVLI